MPRNCTVFVFAVLFFGKVHGFNDTTTCVDVWPKPVSVSCGHMGAMQLSHDFAIQLSETSLVQESTRLEAAFSRCSDKIASTPYRLVRGLTEPQFTFPSDDDDDAAALKRRLSDNFTLPILLSVLVEITTADDNADSAFPALDDDESYVLALPGSDGGGDSAGSPSFFSEVHGNVSGRLTAATVWGAMRGLETLAQLVDQVPPDFTAERGGSAADSGARKVGEPRRGGGGGSGGGGVGGGGGGGSGGGERGHPKKTGASRIRGERTVGGDTEATKASVSSSTFPLLVVRRFPIVIADTPRYPWRGLLLDTANHFLPVHTLETFLDVMSSVKMNVLHWHVVDSYAFPFESESFPDLSLHGAWHPTKAVYSPGDVAWVVAYAADRGIRVLPEFDMPGHAHSWGLSPSLSSLTTSCPRYANELGHLNDVPLDPSQPLTYQVLRGLLGDATSAFPDAYFHLGGDEVQFACWNESEPVLEYMEQLGIIGNRTSEDFRNLEDQFWIQALEALNGEEEERSTEKHISSSSSSSSGGGGDGGGGGGSDGRVGGELEQQKRRVVVWEEVFFVDKDDGDSAPNFRPSSVLLPNSTVIESWTGPSYLAAATAHGYDALLAYGWYLDRQTPVDGVTTWFWQDSWAQMWAVEPEPVLVSPLVPTQSGQQKQQQQQQQQPTAAATQTHAHTQTRENLGRVLGGEASLWSEQVDPLNAHAQSWPRAAAVAERLWSLRMENAEVHAEVEGVAAGETGTGVRPNTVGGGEGTGNRELADAARRLGALRCRFVAWHKLASAPLWSDFCSAAYD